MLNDDMLSQDEIDALLGGTDDESSDSQNQGHAAEEFLSDFEKDALGEIGNISFGSSATVLSTLLNQKVEITTPLVSVVLKSRLKDEFPHPYVAVQVNYTEGFSGSNLLVIRQSDAAIIADIMLGGDGKNPPEGKLGEIQISAVQEAMNQMMGSAATSMSTVFNKKVDISPPSIDILDIKEGEGTERIPEVDSLIKVSFRLKVGDLIDSNIMQLLPKTFGKDLAEDLLFSEDSNQMAVEGSHKEQAMNSKEEIPVQHAMDEVAATSLLEREVGHEVNHGSAPQYIGAGVSKSSRMATPNIQPAEFSNFERTPMTTVESNNLDMLLDIPLKVTVELGRTKQNVKDVLELSSGSIIELDKLAGEPVDILVNNKKIAQGEVVVIEENFGVRVTDIISQSDRVKKLR
ncbi:flagellar motor switch phosphatase FliY [Cytobacillus sp. IB215316]|uniref:flagellar motor switch phosphatase FliY n=1 Tax=Cytobacillus sp. IB215316 TaxID=3097354 RepID=UPI002A11AC53|nr:flagellar motor switch phosphatase FliY [Cytobacillus sp. IB215316]MDX8362243.1 flagellar motor switch phosphatase FliY [Cytobacillus sp. IB215316]